MDMRLFNAKFGMIRDGDSDRRIFYSLLHHDVTASSSDFREPLAREDGANFAARQNT